MSKQNDLISSKNIVPVEIEDQMEKSYLAYAMSVIVGRALPDVRDGLKPVHRRILHAMNERAWRHDKPFVKSAKIVGEVIGNYHPHGDSAVYDTLVRLAQDFSMKVQLIDGQGNFGSVDGDPAAAYRYTEARLTHIAESLLYDIDKETVNFVDNFDGSKQEPVVLPAAWPNLLVNGSSGIAVGMATKIPPHNLEEVINAVEHLIKNPNATIQDLMKHVPAPDFPTGGTILGKDGLKSAYTTGKGSITIRAVATIESDKKGKDMILIHEIPYEVKKNDLLMKIADLVNDKKIEGISEIRDESDRNGMRVALYLRKDANAQIILNQLYKKSNMQINYGIIFLALVNNEPKLLNLKEILENYILHRKEIVTRRTQFLLREAEKKAHILEGLKIALDFIDEVIKLIRKSETVEIARKQLISQFKLTEVQANAILEMRLQKLTSLESKKVLEELQELNKKIKQYKELLKSETKINNVITEEIQQIKQKYKKTRFSQLELVNKEDLSFEDEDLIKNQDEVITINENGYIKRVSLGTFKRQQRGGKGVTSGSKNKEIPTLHILICQSHDYILFFSNRGKVFYLKAYDIEESNKDTRGKNLKSILSLSSNESITAIRSCANFDEGQYLLLITKYGIIKKLELKQIQNAKKGGILAVQFKPNSADHLVDVAVVKNNDDIFMSTQSGLGLRTNLAKMRAQGRTASGIIGMHLEEGNFITSVDVVSAKKYVLAITSKGFGKRVKYLEFSSKGRGGKGMIFFKVSTKTGRIVGIRSINDTDDIIITTKSGMIIRIIASDISVQGRTAAGIKLVSMKNAEDSIQDLTVLNTNSTT